MISILKTLSAVGLDYLQLGQSALTLSGGEAQRLKLATELAKTNSSRTLFVLDEPTSGLHSADVDQLLKVLRGLVQEGHSVVVIEHHVSVMQGSDWIIDVGPEGGEQGGRIIGEGTPLEIAKKGTSPTGLCLREWL